MHRNKNGKVSKLYFTSNQCLFTKISNFPFPCIFEMRLLFVCKKREKGIMAS